MRNVLLGQVVSLVAVHAVAWLVSLVLPMSRTPESVLLHTMLLSLVPPLVGGAAAAWFLARTPWFVHVGVALVTALTYLVPSLLLYVQAGQPVVLGALVQLLVFVALHAGASWLLGRAVPGRTGD